MMVNSQRLNNAKRAMAKGNICNTLAPMDNIKRANFDPANKEHLAQYKEFRLTGKWSGSNPFNLEWPYISVPAVIEAKIINHALGL